MSPKNSKLWKMLKDFLGYRDVSKQHELLHERICLPGNKEMEAKLNTRRVNERLLDPSGQNATIPYWTNAIAIFCVTMIMTRTL